MTREELNDRTRKEWRELGFFYEYDENNSRWRLVGSQQGLLKFCDILDEYVVDEKKASISEHEHYGPYWYLKLVTWTEAVITRDDIRGTLEDFIRLADLTKRKLKKAAVGDKFVIDVEYSPKNEAKILFEIKAEGFDAATEDPLV